MENNEVLVIFDSNCNLCLQSISFLKRKLKKNDFSFIPLDSPSSVELALRYMSDLQMRNSLVLIQKGKVYVRSSAVLRITLYLKGLWPLLSIFLIVPVPVRDFIYNIIARNRYRWFGKCESCVSS